MNRSDLHSMSKVFLQIDFDQKDKVNELQAEFSKWTNTEMLNVVDRFFSSVCPKDQTWKIDRLSLDLGTVDYTNLTANLTRRFQEALSDRFHVLQNNEHSFNGGLEIVDNDLAEIDTIKGFLLSGRISNTSGSVVSINTLLLQLLVDNPEEVVTMIRQISSDEVVRKRLAFQFREDVLKKLIRVLEPYHYEQILVYVDELQQIQKKEQIVQTTTPDFKQQVWFWVLNNLLVGRGTLFNQVEFMENAIRQMANHYNIDYITLFARIEEIVLVVSSKYAIKTDFIKVLKLLSAKQKRQDKNFELTTDDYYTEKNWKTLKALFINRKLRQTKVYVFQKLFENFLKQEPEALKALILDLKSGQTELKPIWQDLNKEQVISLIELLTPEAADKIKQSFPVLKSVLNQNGLKPEATDQLEEWSLEYLVKKGKGNFSIDDYLDKMITRATPTLKNQEVLRFSKSLFSLEPQTIKFELQYFEIYKALRALSVSRFVKNLCKNEKHKVKATELLSEQASAGNFSSEEVMFYRKVFEEIAKTEPELFVTLLKQMLPKVGIQTTIFLLTPMTESVVLKVADKQLNKILNVVEIERLKTGDSANLVFQLKRKLLNEVLLNLSNNSMPEKDYWLTLVLNLITELANSGSEADVVQGIISPLSQSVVIRQIKGAEEILNRSVKYMSDSAVEETIRQIDLSMLSRPVKLMLEARIRSAIRNNSRLFLAKFTEKEKGKIISFFLSEGGEVFSEWQKTKTKLYNPKTFEISIRKYRNALDMIFWKNLVNLTNNNDKNRLINELEKAFVKQFPERLFEKQLSKTQPSKKNNWINSQPESKRVSGVDRLPDLVEHLILNQPEKLEELVRTVILDENVVLLLNKRLDFNLVLTRIFYHPNKKNDEVKQAFECIVELSKYLTSFTVQDTIRIKLYQALFELLKHPGQRERILNEVFKTTLDLIVKSRNISAMKILTVINDAQISVPEIIIKKLSIMNPVFSQTAVSTYKPKFDQYIQELVDRRLINDFLESLIMDDRVPYWYSSSSNRDSKTWLTYIIEGYQTAFFQFLKTHHSQALIWQKTVQLITVYRAFEAVRQFHPNKSKTIDHLSRLYGLFNPEHLNPVQAEQLKQSILTLLLNAVAKENWSGLSPENIWKSLIREATINLNIDAEDLIRDLIDMELKFPKALRHTLKSVLSMKQDDIQLRTGTSKKSVKQKDSAIKYNRDQLREGIAITNAGIVLVSGYLKFFLSD